MMEQPAPPPRELEVEPISIGATFHNIRQILVRWWKKHPIIATAVLVILLFTIYSERPYLIQPFLLAMRIYAGGVLLVVGLAVLIWLILRKRSLRVRVFGGAFAIVVGGVVVVFGILTHNYLTQYIRYETLRVVDINTLPITGHERVLPLHGVYTIMGDRMNETEEPSIPDLVRIGSEYRWTMAVQPSQLWGRFFHHINEMVNISATEPSPDFSRRDPQKVNFNFGENRIWSHNTTYCVRRTFGLWRSWHYEPGNVLYMKDDAGKWVQVVSLIRWAGVIFPWPEFGGVQVIEQGETNIISRVVMGCGRWIPPQDIPKHKFLEGQNLVPYEVSRFMAASQRFQGGFFGPIKLNRQGDLRIADVENDINPQPFTLFFQFEPGKPGKLYQYLALEPYDVDKRGLAISFFVPADGIGPIYRYQHFNHKEAPLGPTAVESQIQPTRKAYDWTNTLAAEVRPFIRDITDEKGVTKRRFEWMVTIVSLQRREHPDDPIEFNPGSDPEIAMVDVYLGRVTWVDHLNPDKWPDELKEALAPVWAREAQ